MLTISIVKHLHLMPKEMKADSLRWVQIIIAVEATFDVEVDVDSMKKFVTIGDFVQYIEKAGKQ
jgi:acyl carrier protein